MSYPVTPTYNPDLHVLEPEVFGDCRGFFFESLNQKAFSQATGLDEYFVQENQSRCTQGVMRGAVFDMAVDIRKSSPTFGQWAGVELTEDNHKQFLVPPDFAHGFAVLSETADFLYKTTDYYTPAYERCIACNDPSIAIAWHKGLVPMLSDKDHAGRLIGNAEVFA